MTLTIEVNALQLVNTRRQILDESGVTVLHNLLYLFLIVPVIKALRKHPNTNIKLTEESLSIVKDIDIGVAMDTECGLMVPGIHKADRKGLFDIGSVLKNLCKRVAGSRCLPEVLNGGSFTITNPFIHVVRAISSIINPPKGVIFGVKAIVHFSFVVDGQEKGQKTVTLYLSDNHYLLDSASVTRFVQYVAQMLERPLVLFTS